MVRPLSSRLELCRVEDTIAEFTARLKENHSQQCELLRHSCSLPLYVDEMHMFTTKETIELYKKQEETKKALDELKKDEQRILEVLKLNEEHRKFLLEEIKKKGELPMYKNKFEVRIGLNDFILANGDNELLLKEILSKVVNQPPELPNINEIDSVPLCVIIHKVPYTPNRYEEELSQLWFKHMTYNEAKDLCPYDIRIEVQEAEKREFVTYVHKTVMLPDEVERRTIPPKPTLWQRIKNKFKRRK